MMGKYEVSLIHFPQKSHANKNLRAFIFLVKS